MVDQTKQRLTVSGTVNLADLRSSISTTRMTFTRLRKRRDNEQGNKEAAFQPDFITLVSLICNLYREFERDLIPLQQFHPDAERQEDGGHTCIVTRRAISIGTASNVKRGTIDDLAEDIVVKRTKESVLTRNSAGLKSFLNELRIRTHPPIRTHPNIAAFKGVAWDFEDDEATRPRPLLLEELAPQRSLESFWRNYNFLRMTFQSKIDFLLDIADALATLHKSRIVHGDVKPDNILIFPRIGHRDAFMAKLTDFGHSVSAHENLKSLPAFTHQWSAPEVLDDQDMTFENMIAADVYSYGLVALSIMIGRSYHRDFDDFEAVKKDDTMFDKSMELVERYDRENQDSDFELDVIRGLLFNTLRHNPRRRSLPRCVRILRRHRAIQTGLMTQSHYDRTSNHTTVLGALDIAQMICIGHQTLSHCAYQVKGRIFEELQLIALKPGDPRQPAAAWELSICYFSGFGIAKDFSRSLHWLDFAASQNIPAAQVFSSNLRHAAATNTKTTLEAVDQKPQQVEADQDRDQEKLVALPLDPGSHDGTKLDVSAMRSGENEHVVNEGQASSATRMANVTIYGLDSDIDSDTSEAIKEEFHATLTDRVVEAVTNTDLSFLSALIAQDPGILNARDSKGDTLLVIAARLGKAQVMELLLSEPSIDASICNHSQQSALHFMSQFDGDQIQTIVPRLIARKADPFHEALPLQSSEGHLGLGVHIRCDPVLQSILTDNLLLLKCLLDEVHRSQDVVACRICEAGSRLRRTVAIALSAFRSEALAIILNHVKTFKDEVVDLSKTEVWSNQTLIPLWKVPFKSIIINSIDVSEFFFRAMYYGRHHVSALHSAILLLLDGIYPETDIIYKMLQEAVKSGSLDAVHFILDEGRRRRGDSFWWLSVEQEDFPQSPLVLAIRCGRREIFEKLWTSVPNISKGYVDCILIRETSAIASLLSSSGIFYERTRPINLVHVCLALAVAAPHQDSFFWNFIIQHANRSCITKRPTSFDGHVSQHPTSFLCQAILMSSFSAATTISKAFPELWNHRLTIDIMGSRANCSSAETKFPTKYLQESSNSMVAMYQSLNYSVTKEGYRVTNPTVAEYVLLTGSHKHCVFLMANCPRLSSITPAEPDTNRISSRDNTQSSASTTDDGTPVYLSYRLNPSEYHCLLLGNLVQDRDDRYQTWDIVRTQIAAGHPRSLFYLRLAISHGNNYAVTQLLDLGWPVNGPSWAIFMTPLQLSTFHEKLAIKNKTTNTVTYRTEISDDLDPRWGRLDSHKSVFRMFLVQRKVPYHPKEVMKQISENLRASGAQVPKAVEFLRSQRGMMCIGCVWFILYGALLPVVIPLTSGKHWSWNVSFWQKFAWMYCWSACVAMNSPFAHMWYPTLFREYPALRWQSVTWCPSTIIGCSIIYAVLFIIQHIVPFALMLKLYDYGWGYATIVFLGTVALYPIVLFCLLLGTIIKYTVIGIVIALPLFIIDLACTSVYYFCYRSARRGPFDFI